MPHDLDPHAEYDTATLAELMPDKPTQQEAIAQACTDVIEAIWQRLGFAEKPEVFHVLPGSLEGVFGIFCAGTSSRPLVGLDVVEIDRFLAENTEVWWHHWAADQGHKPDVADIDREVVHEVRETLAYLLAFAWMESAGVDDTDEPLAGERKHALTDAADEFARGFVNEGCLNMTVLEAMRIDSEAAQPG